MSEAKRPVFPAEKGNETKHSQVHCLYVYLFLRVHAFIWSSVESNISILCYQWPTTAQRAMAWFHIACHCSKPSKKKKKT